MRARGVAALDRFCRTSKGTAHRKGMWTREPFQGRRGHCLTVRLFCAYGGKTERRRIRRCRAVPLRSISMAAPALRTPQGEDRGRENEE